MTLLPNEKTELPVLLGLACRHYLAVFKSTIGCILIITLAQALANYIGNFFVSIYIVNTLHYVSMVVILFFWGAMLYQADGVLTEQPISMFAACRHMSKCMLAFFIAALLLVAFAVAYYSLFSYLTRFVEHGSLKAILLFLFLFILPVIVVLVLMIFALPLTVLEGRGPLSALGYSARLVREWWPQAFTVYMAFGVIYILVSSDTRHAQFFMRHHVLWLFNLFVYGLLLPVFTNYVILMLNNVVIARERTTEASY